jgi:predicted membrane protein
MTQSRKSNSGSWKKTLLRGVLVCFGSVAILLPAWLPNKPGAPMERGTVELLQAALLAASTAVMIGAMAHAGHRRCICRVLAFGLAAALVGELEDFISGIMKWPFPDAWVIGLLVLMALITVVRHRYVMLKFFSTLGHHAGAGFIGAALLIIYVFSRVIGTQQFWQASMGDAFSPEIPKICKSYLELLACYFIFVGSIGLAITLGRREELD